MQCDSLTMFAPQMWTPLQTLYFLAPPPLQKLECNVVLQVTFSNWRNAHEKSYIHRWLLLNNANWPNPMELFLLIPACFQEEELQLSLHATCLRHEESAVCAHSTSVAMTRINTTIHKSCLFMDTWSFCQTHRLTDNVQGRCLGKSCGICP